MKRLPIGKRLIDWQKIIILFSCIGLLACTDPISIYKPLDVSQAGQSVKVDFEISKVGDYQFALLFDTGDGHDELERRFKLFGNNNDDGVVIPVSLRLIKDGQVFFDRTVNAAGYGWGRSFYYEERLVTTAVRNIRILELSPGHYSVIITTLQDVPAFKGIESFVQVTYFNPKV